jgi:hypothetical protein
VSLSSSLAPNDNKGENVDSSLGHLLGSRIHVLALFVL